MSELDDAFEKIVRYKAEKIKGSNQYTQNIRDVLREKGVLQKHGIRESDNVVNALVEVFKMGAVDGMIYDVASLSNFTSHNVDHDDWASWNKRSEMLMELFCEL